ncbi:hypothetical protein NS319_02960 [Sphingomonas sanguinis]|uniref:Uncharacterized protein n=2 Tax=Sphingomonas sanguinis TaxID=33051 RepID=A0A147I4X9_9SPHN|nr:hypothetical protein NS319_02960 [Sphingomonas sanguinis]
MNAALLGRIQVDNFMKILLYSYGFNISVLSSLEHLATKRAAVLLMPAYWKGLISSFDALVRPAGLWELGKLA